MTNTTIDQEASTGPAVDEARLQQVALDIFGAYAASMVTLMIDLADRTGLFPALAAGPGTSDELAARAGLHERYVRECLASLVTGGIVDHDPVTRSFYLSPEHELCLTGDGSANLAPLSRIPSLLATYLDEAEEVVREGGGIPYERFRPAFTTVMDGVSRGVFDEQLLTAVVPRVDGLEADLERGIRVADIGCGTGHSTVVLARAFPASTFVGYDLAEDGLALGQREAAEAGLTNVRFERLDVRELPVDPPLDLVVAFDVIHDQADPAGVLEQVHRALVPGGRFLMMDIKASSDLENNRGNPFAPFLYGVSTLHCMTVSLAEGGAGLGTCWGQELAQTMLAEAGFTDVQLYDVPDDPLNQVYLARPDER